MSLFIGRLDLEPNDPSQSALHISQADEPITASGARDLPTVDYPSSVGQCATHCAGGCARAKETAATNEDISITATSSNLERPLTNPNTKTGLSHKHRCLPAVQSEDGTSTNARLLIWPS